MKRLGTRGTGAIAHVQGRIEMPGKRGHWAVMCMAIFLLGIQSAATEAGTGLENDSPGRNTKQPATVSRLNASLSECRENAQLDYGSTMLQCADNVAPKGRPNCFKGAAIRYSTNIQSCDANDRQ